MAHQKLKTGCNNRPGGALQLRLRQYSERPSGPSLLEWAYYLLEPHEGIDKNDDRILNNDKDLKRPMISYEITDDEINWKKESNIDTAGTIATASVTEEDKLLSKYDWSGENKTSATLRHNIADALKLSHSRYSKLKKLNNTQQEERNIIELGMLSIMQMHFNATDTNMKKTGKIPSLR